MRQPITVATLALLSVAGLAWAQGGSKPQNPTPARPAPTANAQPPATTLVGCLYREDQIPGRTPNVAERAGVLEDYILADASPATQKPGSEATAPAPGATPPPSGNMYKVEGPSDETLKSLVGKKVEVGGRIDAEGSPGATGKPRPDRGPGPDKINLPEFEATSIREVPGTCPSTPAPRK